MSGAHYIPLDNGFEPELPPSLSLRGQAWKETACRLVLPLLVISVLVNLLLLWSWPSCGAKYDTLCPRLLYSPAHAAVEYEVISFKTGVRDDASILDHPPSSDVDQAWEELYKYAATKIPKHEAARLTNKTWPILGDEQNYMLAYDVFHQLHCLDDLRRRAYGSEDVTPWMVRQCVASLRQSIMCASDLSPIVWQWSNITHSARERADVAHTCRNFEKIREWVKRPEHHIDIVWEDLDVYIEDDLTLLSS